MLILHRTVDQTITISPSENIPPEMTAEELFSSGNTTITVTKCRGGKVKLGVEAPAVLDIARGSINTEGV